MIDHPDFVVVARRHRHRLETDRDGGAMLQAVALDAETSRRPSGVLAAKRNLPLGERARGRT